MSAPTIPEGFTPHDGKGFPHGLAGRPAIMFEDGRIIEAGLRQAEYWLVGYWTHHFGPRERIIAYRVETSHD